MTLAEMAEYLRLLQRWVETHEALAWWLGISSVVTFLGTMIGLALAIILLPAQYFKENPAAARKLPIRNPVLKFSYLIFKNILGLVLMAAGLVMLVTPGQGLISILIGVSLTSFPGKRRLIRRIIGNRRVLDSANRLRRKFSRPPLEAPD